jgi:alcohol dehydrogenase (NADP+)
VFTVNAYAAVSATAPLTATTVERRDVGPLDVLIAIKYAGICYTDIQRARSQRRQERYPMVPGHEIVGIVDKVGAAVTRHAIGDRVGVGGLVDSCRVCASCRDGRECDCIEGCTETYAGVGADGQLTQGGYSTHIVVTEDFVLKIPDALSLDEAAPLLYAGVTNYAALRRFGVVPGKKVAIIGLGGLGHLGVKLAHAMGAEVSVFSHSWRKQDDARRLGADHCYATSDANTFATLGGSFDLVLNTDTTTVLDSYLSLLGWKGVLVNLVIPAEQVCTNVFSLISNRRSLTGSTIGSLDEIQETLAFCAAHNLGADIEVIEAQQINEAFDRLLASDVRYRFVIDTAAMA